MSSVRTQAAIRHQILEARTLALSRGLRLVVDAETKLWGFCAPGGEILLSFCPTTARALIPGHGDAFRCRGFKHALRILGNMKTKAAISPTSVIRG